MRKGLFVAALAVSLSVSWPSSAYAWGFAGHKLILDKAIDLLPPELKPFFDHFRSDLLVRVTDPDEWRNVGWDDDQNHFVDFGVPEYGKYPFTELPREYGAALEKFGGVQLKRNGLLPWREQDEYGNLRRTFEDFKRESSVYRVDTLVLFSAIASHYIQDAYQPFHATNNYDGGLTGQNGIHARFERDLIEKFADRLQLTPAPPKGIAKAGDAAFDALLKSYQDVDLVLQADKEAAAGKDAYDDDYFEKFFAKVKPVLEERLSGAISATAGVIIGAWEQAGRPAVPIASPRPVQRIRR
jgi:hypothetical protein